MPSGHQPSMSSIEQSLQYLIANSNATNAKLDIALNKLESIGARMDNVETDVKHAFSEIFELKDKINSIEQKDRSLAIRVFGLSISEDERESSDQTNATAKLVYDKIVRPILIHARDQKLIPTLPQYQNAISEAFRLPSKKSSTASSTSSSSSRPPPILVKLASSQIKIAIFKSKSALPEPSEAEKAAGTKRYHLAEDLTPATFNLLMDLRNNSAVERAWTTEGQVRYTLKDDRTSYVHKVKSVFEPIDSYIKK
jgi:hypothetical protein